MQVDIGFEIGECITEIEQNNRLIAGLIDHKQNMLALRIISYQDFFDYEKHKTKLLYRTEKILRIRIKKLKKLI